MTWEFDRAAEGTTPAPAGGARRAGLQNVVINVALVGSTAVSFGLLIAGIINAIPAGRRGGLDAAAAVMLPWLVFCLAILIVLAAVAGIMVWLANRQ